MLEIVIVILDTNSGYLHPQWHWITVDDNSSYRSYQRFEHANKATGSFSIVLTHKPRLHVTVNKGGFAGGATAITAITPCRLPNAYTCSNRETCFWHLSSHLTVIFFLKRWSSYRIKTTCELWKMPYRYDLVFRFAICCCLLQVGSLLFSLFGGKEMEQKLRQ